MSIPKLSSQVVPDTDLDHWITRINSVLDKYSDKSWNYSRIMLVTKPVQLCNSVYFFVVELLDMRDKNGQSAFKNILDEISWGDHHSSELGILEIISLRINKALAETSSDTDWNYLRPVIRISKIDQLMVQHVTQVVWYEVHEIAGVDFDSR